MSKYSKWILKQASDPSVWGTPGKYTIKHLPTGECLWISNGASGLHWDTFEGRRNTIIPWWCKRRLWNRLQKMLQNRMMGSNKNGETHEES